MGGQFEPKLGGQFELESGGQFAPKWVVNLVWNWVVNLTVFSTLESGGKIDVFVESLDENQIRCIVQDNGIGREKAIQQSNKDHISFATIITEERLKAFEKKHRIHFKVETIDILNIDGSTGTKVIINLPLM